MIFDCYTPPEVLRGTAVANKAIDLYRLGATLYTVSHGAFPSFFMHHIATHGYTEQELDCHVEGMFFFVSGRVDLVFWCSPF